MFWREGCRINSLGAESVGKLDAEDSRQIVEVDIATRFVDEDDDVFVVRPGKGYSLYDVFQDENIVFLDFPGLRLNFASRPGRRDTTNLREQLVRSIKLRDWHLGGRQGREPSRDISAYKGKASGRRLGRYIGDIGRLYYEFEPGTIVVVPGPGYISDVLIGVIVGSAEESSDVQRYPDEKVPIRKVEWLGKKLKATFTPELRSYLSRPDPVMRLDGDFHEEILRAAFAQYAINGEFSARLETTRRDFSTLDDFNLQAFINFIAGVAAADEHGGYSDDEVDLGDALALLAAAPDGVPELASNINSPGFLRLTSGKIVPLTVAVIMSAVLAVPAGAQTPEIRIRNSAALKNDPCAVQIEEQVRRVIRMSSTEDLLQVCAQMRDASEKTGLKTAMPAKVKKQKSR